MRAKESKTKKKWARVEANARIECKVNREKKTNILDIEWLWLLSKQRHQLSHWHRANFNVNSSVACANNISFKMKAHAGVRTKQNRMLEKTRRNFYHGIDIMAPFNNGTRRKRLMLMNLSSSVCARIIARLAWSLKPCRM